MLRIIDSLSRGKIAAICLLAFLFLAAFFYFALIVPLDKQREESVLQKDALACELQNLQRQQTEVQNKLKLFSDLPQTAELLHLSFLHNAVEIEEIYVAGDASPRQAGLNPIVIKVTAAGDRSSLLEAINEVQINSSYLCLLQDMDINQGRAVINFKLLTQDKP